MPTYEGLRLKVLKYWRRGLASSRKKQLTNTEFTIISNNCWGGMIYESYQLQKKSPTVGLFFMADDYIKFISNIREYLCADLRFIKPEESKWKDEVSSDKRFGNYPIGKLQIILGGEREDIEIFFLHYLSENEAREKWARRIQRINWDNFLVKFNDQNGCTEEHIKQFNCLQFKNKICFTVREYPQYRSVKRVKAPKSHTFIRSSYEPFGKSITRILNSI